MSVTLQVEFRGLTGLVPRGSSTDDQSFLFVLPDLRSGYPGDDLPHKDKDSLGGVLPHLPAAVVPTRSIVDQSDKRSAFKFTQGDEEYSVFVFDYEALAFEGLIPAPIRANMEPVQPGDCTTEFPKDEDEVRCLRWMPQLSLANHQHQNAVGLFDQSRFLHPNMTPERRDEELRLAGTVLVKYGELFVEDVIRVGGQQPERRPLPFVFRVPDGAEEWRQAVYDRLMWNAKVQADTLRMVFLRGPSGDRRVVELQPIQERYDIEIANLELADLLGPPGYWPGPDGDLDYAIFYHFATSSPDRSKMPVPFPSSAPALGRRPRCKAAMFDKVQW